MGGDGGSLALLGLVAVVPLVALMLTSFVKVSVVLSLLRNALGATDAPSGLIVMGLSLVLTAFVMAPVAAEMVQAAATAPDPASGASPGSGTASAPASATGTAAAAGTTTGTAAPAGTATAGGTATAKATATGGLPAAGSPALALAPPLELEAALRAVLPPSRHAELAQVSRALGPLRRFLARHAAVRDRATFVELAARMGHAAAEDELRVLAPAFLTTELREAFAIAVLVFVPFLVLDLLIGLGLAALGLATTSPQVVALPLKLLLFVAVDGWRLLVDSLLRGYV